MKAQFNQLLESQRSKVQNLESQVCNAKLTYADALRNLEQISDEIHRTRNKTHRTLALAEESKMEPSDTIGSFPEYSYNDDEDEYMSLPATLSATTSPIQTPLDDVSGFRSIPGSSSHPKPQKSNSQSSEWTEINLEVSSPEDDVPYRRLDTGKPNEKKKLVKQNTLPVTDLEITNTKPKSKLDSSIVNWISRSSAKTEQDAAINGSKFGTGPTKRYGWFLVGAEFDNIKENLLLVN